MSSHKKSRESPCVFSTPPAPHIRLAVVFQQGEIIRQLFQFILVPFAAAQTDELFRDLLGAQFTRSMSVFSGKIILLVFRLIIQAQLAQDVKQVQDRGPCLCLDRLRLRRWHWYHWILPGWLRRRRSVVAVAPWYSLVAGQPGHELLAGLLAEG